MPLTHPDFPGREFNSFDEVMDIEKAKRRRLEKEREARDRKQALKETRGMAGKTLEYIGTIEPLLVDHDFGVCIDITKAFEEFNDKNEYLLGPLKVRITFEILPE